MILTEKDIIASGFEKVYKEASHPKQTHHRWVHKGLSTKKDITLIQIDNQWSFLGQWITNTNQLNLAIELD
jgi:hypothetical protein